MKRLTKLKMYASLASWWPLVSAPVNYKEEAGIFARILNGSCRPCKEVLELGSGGGNNASHLKKWFRMTLVDISPGMVRVSKKLNPDCKHVRGDMRSVRLRRLFDGVFIHDAVMYLTTRRDLLRAFRTAYAHLREQGCVLVVPDFFKETFKPEVSYHGHDLGNRGIRYLEWRFDPDPRDTTCDCHFAYLVRRPGRRMKIEYDRHVLGVFPRVTWIKLLKQVGFKVKVIPIRQSELEPNTYFGLLGKK